MSLATFPKRVLLSQITEDGLHWTGDLPLEKFSRLNKEAVKDDQLNTADNSIFIDLNITPDKRSHHIFQLQIDSAGHIPLQCQRCLQNFLQVISVNVQITLLEDSSYKKLLNEDEDYLTLEDVSGYSTKYGLDVKEMVEDELLLSLPISPKHDECEMTVQTIGEINETVEKDDNPFSVLADLKGKL